MNFKKEKYFRKQESKQEQKTLAEALDKSDPLIVKHPSSEVADELKEKEKLRRFILKV